jgi:translation elongation factor EF-G
MLISVKRKIRGFEVVKVSIMHGDRTVDKHAITDFETSIQTGYQLATGAGPLCGEPMSSICVFIQNFSTTHADSTPHTSFSS